MRKNIGFIFGVVILAMVIFSPVVNAQEGSVTVSDSENRIKVQVIEIIKTYTDTNEYGPAIKIQEVKAQVIQGEQKGEIVTFKNDYAVMEAGDKIYLDTTTLDTGEVIYAVSDFDRKPVLIIFLLLFIALVVGFGKMQAL